MKQHILGLVRWLTVCCWICLTAAHAQTPWPPVQAENYPTVDGMRLVRHEQSILLGEGPYQTGLFFSVLPNAFSAQVQNLLFEDAVRKSWVLQSVMRQGTRYVLAFTKGPRLLDIRLTNMPDGVEAVYSIVLNQQGPATPLPPTPVKTSPQDATAPTSDASAPRP